MIEERTFKMVICDQCGYRKYYEGDEDFTLGWIVLRVPSITVRDGGKITPNKTKEYHFCSKKCFEQFSNKM